MRVEYISEYNFYVYLNKYYISELELNNRPSIEDYFKKVFISLKNNYHIDIYGYYSIKVYVNKQYGIVIDVMKLNNDYFKVLNNKVDMKIIIDNDSVFLYEIDDYFLAVKYKNEVKNIYSSDDKYYLELDEKIKEKDYLNILEHSRIIFNDQAYEIMSTSLKI